MKRALLNGGSAPLTLSVERRFKRDSALHKRADQFERDQINSFLVVSVDPLGQVFVDFDAGALGEGTEMDLAKEFGKLAAGAMQGHDHLMGQVAEIAACLAPSEPH